MKTKSIILSSALLTIFVAITGTSFAGASKYNKEEVATTKGIAASENAMKHGNKYCRTAMEKEGLGGSILPSTNGVQGNSKYSR